MIAIPKFATWSLKAKFALCIGALMFAYSVAFTTWTLRGVRTDLRSSIVDAQLALVRTTARDIDAKVELRRDALATISMLLSEAAPAPGFAMDAFFAPRPVLHKMFDSVLVIDTAGKAVYESRRNTADLAREVAGNAYFKAVLAGDGVLISAPMNPVAGGDPFVVFASRLHSPDGKVSGALVCTLNLLHGNFLGELGKVRIGREGYFAIVERNDNPVFVMHKDPRRVMTTAAGGANNPIQVQSRQGKEGTIEGSNSMGVDTLRSFTPLRSVPWVLVAVYPTDEAFAQLLKRQSEVIWMGLTLFLAASTGTWMMSAVLLRPLTRLRQEMDRHASDRGLPMPPRSFGSMELAALATAYNSQSQRRSEVEDRLEASERFMKNIADNMPALVAYIDRDQVYRFANARYLDWLGVDPAFMVGLHKRDVVAPAQYASARPLLEAAMRGERVSAEGHAELDGKRIDLQIEYIPDIAGDGTVKGCYALSIDITERRASELAMTANLTALKEARRLQESVEQRLRAITDNLPAMIAYIDRDERFRFVNRTFETWFGIDPVRTLGKSFLEVFGTAGYEAHRSRLIRCLAGERVAFEIDADTLEGKKVLQIDYIPDLDSEGRVSGFYTLSADVTELKDAQRQLSLLVCFDSLTGLANRYQFNESLPRASDRCRRSGLAMALMFLDVDHFKQVNDTLGHAAGDAVLKEFARRLRNNVRSTDTVARLGGDEFVVILENLHSDEEAQAVARKILAAIDGPFDICERPLRVTTSVGIAFQGVATETTGALLERADAALYQAKAAGRNTYSLSKA